MGEMWKVFTPSRGGCEKVLHIWGGGVIFFYQYGIIADNSLNLVGWSSSSSSNNEHLSYVRVFSLMVLCWTLRNIDINKLLHFGTETMVNQVLFPLSYFGFTPYTSWSITLRYWTIFLEDLDIAHLVVLWTIVVRLVVMELRNVVTTWTIWF